MIETALRLFEKVITELARRT